MTNLTEKPQDYVKKSHNVEENEPKSEKIIKDVQENCLSLTEQWKRGELSCGCYYVKLLKDGIQIDCYNGEIENGWWNNYDCNIQEVLSPVPSFDEWKSAYECLLMESEEVLTLKELLKKCREVIVAFVDEEPCRYDHHGFCQEHNWFSTDECINKKCKSILTETDGVLDE
jgi:hypothetical protein